ncbi:MAG: tyrosine-type recombinase/integrase [Nocardiopsaceae bacterium]|nr:tyrosine-type recombinase/integrase [Nocardiopsaceae bacterium]
MATVGHQDGLFDAPGGNALGELLERVNALQPEGRAPGTREDYAYWSDRYAAFCAQHDQSPLPATSELLAAWTLTLIDQELSPNTIRLALAAVSARHVDLHLPKPDRTAAANLISGYTRKKKRSGWHERQVDPLRIVHLKTIFDTMDGRPSHLRDRAMMLLNVFAFLRGEELTCLSIEDVTLSEDHQWLTLLLCWSKTDQAGDGVIVDVPRAFETWLDPVKVTLDWIAWLDRQGVQEGPLFRQMNKNGRELYVHPRAKAPWPRQGGMSREAYTQILQRWTDRAGVPGDFASHSGRRGAATEASRRGATPSEIADAGRWKPGSTVLWRYIEGLNRNDRRRNHPMARVLRPADGPAGDSAVEEP